LTARPLTNSVTATNSEVSSLRLMHRSYPRVDLP
jgi:hypothetical protein